jgi:hypothetical protein
MLSIDLSIAKQQQEGCLAGTWKGQMERFSFVQTSTKNRLYFYVAIIERLKYDQNFNIKCDKVDKIQDTEVDNLKRVRHV